MVYSGYLVHHVELEDAVVIGQRMVKLRSWLEERRELNIGAERHSSKRVLVKS